MNSLTEIWFKIHSALFEFVFLLKLKRHKCLSGGLKMKTKMYGLAIWKNEKCLLLLHIFWIFRQPCLSSSLRLPYCRLESKQTDAFLRVNLQSLKSMYFLNTYAYLIVPLNSSAFKHMFLPTLVITEDFRRRTRGRQTRGSQRLGFKQNLLYLLKITCNGQCWKSKEISVLFPTKSFSGYSF